MQLSEFLLKIGDNMGLKLREVVKLWLYAIVTLIALTICGWVYIQLGTTAAQFALMFCYGIGALLTYWSGTNPELVGVLGPKAIWGMSLLWFVVLAVAVAGTTLCLLFIRESGTATSVDLPDMF